MSEEICKSQKIGQNVEIYLNKRKAPDLIYVAVPSLDVAEVCAAYCERNNVKFVVDIQDLWPEAFRLVFNIPVVSSMILNLCVGRQTEYIKQPIES